MRSFNLCSAALLLIVAMTGWTGASPFLSPLPPPLTGDEDVTAPRFIVAERPGGTTLDEPIGEVYQVGTTWYDLQHNGSAGKMIAVDNGGWVHLTWMNGLNSTYTVRHVYYNCWNPNTQQMIYPAGVQVDAAARAGYVCQGVTPGGFAFPAFHWMEGSTTRTGAAIDFLPHTGAFTMFAANFNGAAYIWPKIAVGLDSLLHLVSTENSGLMKFYYSRGLPVWDDWGFGAAIDWLPIGPSNEEYVLMDTAAFVSADIAASNTSNRVAIAWTKVRPAWPVTYDSDVFLKISEDGGLTWGPSFNLTQFTAEDTLRAYIDVSVVFDDDASIHVAFSTLRVNEALFEGYSQKSLIWHWSEQHGQFSALGEAWYYSENALPGARMLNANLPSLGVDPVTGFVYCAYQKMDTAFWSAGGYYNADAWVTVSTDGGLHWSVGRNVTDTHPVVNPAPVGQSRHERDITLADRVTYAGGTGYLHLEWELDLDAGDAVSPNPEGSATLNPMYYQRIPVTEIPHSPLLPFYPLHVGECICHDEPDAYCADVDAAIPDGNYTGVQVIVPVEVQYHITDIDVCLDIVHENVGDLSIWLESPQGTNVALTEFSNYGANFTCTMFDDEAAHSIWEGSAPFTGRFRPVGLLSDFDGENAQGEWRLHVMDTVQFGTGFVNYVCVQFEYDEILPVELAAFDVTPAAEGIRVDFRTASETGNDHFEILRATAADGEFAAIASVPSQGNGTGHSYSHLDRGVEGGRTYWYYLVDVSATNERTEHRGMLRSATALGAALPLEYSLAAYPNPFNPVTTLTFGVKEAGIVRVDVYNVNGQRVREAVHRGYPAGTHAVIFDAGELPSGIYFAKMSVNGFVKTEKMVMMK